MPLQSILAEQYQRALDLIRRHRTEIDLLASKLVEQGVVHKGELESLLGEKARMT